MGRGEYEDRIGEVGGMCHALAGHDTDDHAQAAHATAGHDTAGHDTGREGNNGAIWREGETRHIMSGNVADASSEAI